MTKIRSPRPRTRRNHDVRTSPLVNDCGLSRRTPSRGPLAVGAEKYWRRVERRRKPAGWNDRTGLRVQAEVEARVPFGPVDGGQIGRTDSAVPGVARHIVAEPHLGVAPEVAPDIEAETRLPGTVLGDEHVVQIQVPATPIEVEPRRDEQWRRTQRLHDFGRQRAGWCPGRSPAWSPTRRRPGRNEARGPTC